MTWVEEYAGIVIAVVGIFACGFLVSQCTMKIGHPTIIWSSPEQTEAPRP